ncbi:acetyl-CoA carboxylase biotin carboxyl carrier protein subunit [Telluribacter sp. SYSU D00476]|uniref:acetyl-CoA carboxylase biotin carboxyl carrier protein subunit n=1 Tax=Telluribacter sp. SYSU D00476 TaxID=2811430 RepID=UPI001FF4FBEB|nr:acetyl-CoA carboxylase biotin carboxyl carrier protein subunit [Telluribacter sp. SYSU D00476]
MLKITVNESDTYELRQDKDQWWLGDTPFDGNIVDLQDKRYHVIWNDRSYNIEIVESDRAAKTCTLRINGQLYTTSAKNRFDLLLESMGMSKAAGTKVNDVKAPMPGLIQSVSVQVGNEVQKGDTLLVLVAMKMENAIKAPGEGKVKALRINAGDNVEKNQVLVEFE